MSDALTWGNLLAAHGVAIYGSAHRRLNLLVRKGELSSSEVKKFLSVLEVAIMDEEEFDKIVAAMPDDPRMGPAIKKAIKQAILQTPPKRPEYI